MVNRRRAFKDNEVRLRLTVKRNAIGRVISQQAVNPPVSA